MPSKPFHKKNIKKPKEWKKILEYLGKKQEHKWIINEAKSYADFYLPKLERKINALVKAIKSGKVKDKEVALKVLNKLARERLALKNLLKTGEKELKEREEYKKAKELETKRRIMKKEYEYENVRKIRSKIITVLKEYGISEAIIKEFEKQISVLGVPKVETKIKERYNLYFKKWKIHELEEKDALEIMNLVKKGEIKEAKQKLERTWKEIKEKRKKELIERLKGDKPNVRDAFNKLMNIDKEGYILARFIEKDWFKENKGYEEKVKEYLENVNFKKIKKFTNLVTSEKLLNAHFVTSIMQTNMNIVTDLGREVIEAIREILLPAIKKNKLITNEQKNELKEIIKKKMLEELYKLKRSGALETLKNIDEEGYVLAMFWNEYSFKFFIEEKDQKVIKYLKSLNYKKMNILINKINSKYFINSKHEKVMSSIISAIKMILLPIIEENTQLTAKQKKKLKEKVKNLIIKIIATETRKLDANMWIVNRGFETLMIINEEGYALVRFWEKDWFKEFGGNDKKVINYLEKSNSKEIKKFINNIIKLKSKKVIRNVIEAIREILLPTIEKNEKLIYKQKIILKEKIKKIMKEKLSDNNIKVIREVYKVLITLKYNFTFDELNTLFKHLYIIIINSRYKEDNRQLALKTIRDLLLHNIKKNPNLINKQKKELIEKIKEINYLSALFDPKQEVREEAKRISEKMNVKVETNNEIENTRKIFERKNVLYPVEVIDENKTLEEKIKIIISVSKLVDAIDPNDFEHLVKKAKEKEIKIKEWQDLVINLTENNTLREKLKEILHKDRIIRSRNKVKKIVDFIILANKGVFDEIIDQIKEIGYKNFVEICEKLITLTQINPEEIKKLKTKKLTKQLLNETIEKAFNNTLNIDLKPEETNKLAEKTNLEDIVLYFNSINNYKQKQVLRESIIAYAKGEWKNFRYKQLLKEFDEKYGEKGKEIVEKWAKDGKEDIKAKGEEKTEEEIRKEIVNQIEYVVLPHLKELKINERIKEVENKEKDKAKVEKAKEKLIVGLEEIQKIVKKKSINKEELKKTIANIKKPLMIFFKKEEVKQNIKELDNLLNIFSTQFTINNLEIVDSDDFADMFYAGKVINATSCQAFDYNGKEKQGLVGYVELPWIRIMGVREKGEKQYVARRVFKLGFENKKLKIFVEPLYGDAKFDEKILKAISEKAKMIGAEISILEKNEGSENIKFPKSGKAALSYSDILGGLNDYRRR